MGIVIVSMAILTLLSIEKESKKPEFFENGDLKTYNIKDLPKLIKENKANKKKAKGYYKHDKPDKFLQYYEGIRKTWDQEKVMYPANYKLSELKKAQNDFSFKMAGLEQVNFTQRGPANVGGRTRGFVYDPNNIDNWFVASASGGVWKTTDAGESWMNLTQDLPNLSTSCIAMAPSNHNRLYVGTGEGYAYNFSFVRGEGIYTSEDKGDTWNQIEETALSNDFEYVNRLAIHPTNENIVIATTNKGIIKTTDGFATWDLVFQVNDSISSDGSVPAYAQGLAARDDFSKLYATFRNYGVAISSDEGETWELVENLKGIGSRYEVAVSPANQDFIYAVAEVNLYYQLIWVSHDGGNYWKSLRLVDGINPNYLWGQGWYDMTITGHPYNENKFFVGGVNIGEYEFSDTLANDITDVDTLNTGSFLDLINFGADYGDGTVAMETYAISGIDYDEISSVEIRFGPGRAQKAHRFFVPEQATSGMGYYDYEYQDYVEVPFEVWDTDNNRQLMVSFRDQERDGNFNLYETTAPEYGKQGREYIFVHALEYDANSPHPSIDTVNGYGDQLWGTHTYKQFLQLWPTFSGSGNWDENALPSSSINISVDKVMLFDGTTKIISDAYGILLNGGKNTNLHPDHHSLVTIPVNPTYGYYTLVSANDGGVAYSTNEGNSWEETDDGYITSQFYSANKKRGEDIYVGGTQDNGSFLSPFGGAHNSQAEYSMVMSGDGFETLWNYQDPDRLMVSVYNNLIFRSLDGGKNWTYGYEGIDVENSPFITRLASSVSNPDVVYCVGTEGVYKSEDFGTSWSMKKIDRNWMSGQITSSMASYHNVKVSLANDQVVWAGAALNPDQSISTFVSFDAGETYSEVEKYAEREMSAFLTGIATHPHDDSTAYLLFSAPNLPKILRTTDMGQSWEDLSGFGAESSSSKGFPDVAVLSLTVMPHMPNVIWAGTEIGVFESTDEGGTWHKLDGDLPAVSVWQMNIIDDQVVLATFGRGIWTATIPELENTPILFGLTPDGSKRVQMRAELDTPYDELDVYINGSLHTTITSPEQGEEVTIELDVYDIFDLRIQCVGHFNGKEYKSNILTNQGSYSSVPDRVVKAQSLNVFPNPVSDVINFTLERDIINQHISIELFDVNGKLVHKEEQIADNTNTIALSNVNSGNYFLRVSSNEKVFISQVLVK